MGTLTIRRKYLLGGAGVAAVVLATSSLAYACTIFLGSATLQGNAAGPDGKKGTVTAAGSSTGMGYCDSATYDWENKTGTKRALAEGSGHTYVDRVGPPTDPANSVDVSLAPVSNPACEDHTSAFHWGGHLPDGVYNVNFQEGPAFSNTSDDSRVWLLDCMYNTEDYPDDPTVTAKKVGEITVTGGVASGKFSLGSALVPNTAADEAAVCFSNKPGDFVDINGKSTTDVVDEVGTGVFGMQVPVTVL